MTAIQQATTEDHYELHLDGELVAAVIILENGHVAGLIHDGTSFVMLRRPFLTEGGAMRHVRRRVGGGEWWVSLGTPAVALVSVPASC